MKFMQDSMDDRSEHDTHDAYEYQTTEQRIAGGEDFCGVCFYGIDRSHSTKNHRGFEQ